MNQDRSEIRPSEAAQPGAPAWSRPWQEVARELGVEPGPGLATRTARARLQQHGLNRLQELRRKSAWRILSDQFRSLIIVLLGAASLVSFLFGQWLEGVAIALALLINAAIGFVTELKATRSMEALHRLGKTTAKVRREGEVRQIPAEQVAVGDLIVLEAGDLVPADLRVIEANNLQVDESPLTGESVPVTKQEAESLGADTPLAERTNMLFKGTAVTSGSGEALAVATGRKTEVGKIASLTRQAEEEEETPLEKRLAGLGRRLIWATGAIAVLVAGAGLLGGRDWLLVIKTAIAMAVATVPEGLPIVATIAMARGVWRMAARNALVNRLSAVETLGATRVIFTDKTGTLTENRLTVARIRLRPEAVEVNPGEEGVRLQREGSAESLRLESSPLLRRAIETGILCNNATLSGNGEEKQQVGDPLEISLLAVGQALGLTREELLGRLPEVREVPFETGTKMMATFHQDEGGLRVAVKGAPEAVLAASTAVKDGEAARPLDDEERQRWLAWNGQMAADGLRMLAVAEKKAASEEEEPYRDLELLGLVGFLDPPRRDISTILEQCRQAGIQVVMVTGDQAATAAAVARAIRLTPEERPRVVEGKELRPPEELSEVELHRLRQVSIFARVNPEQKLDLISIHQAHGEVVAMTGDGVNDAPALKKADIGIAMGRRGTQVAKEAADMVLKDDRFSTIMVAVEHGRVIFDNIRKFIIYLLSGNVSEVLIISLAGLAGAPLPLLPLQILYINLIGDVFPALGLGLGTGAPAIMQRPPRGHREQVLARRHWLAVIGYSVIIAAAVLGAFALALTTFGLTDQEAISIAFITLVLARLWHVFNMRDRRSDFFHNEITANPYIWGALAIGGLLLLGAIYLPGLSTVLQVTPPDQRGWLLIAGASLVPLLMGQTMKYLIKTKEYD